MKFITVCIIICLIFVVIGFAINNMAIICINFVAVVLNLIALIYESKDKTS